MNSFRTEIFPDKAPIRLSYQSRMLFIGSCFAENIGEKFKNFGFHVTINPFGVLYNPLSVARSFDILARCKKYNESDLFQHDGLWHSYDHHGSFSGTDINQCLYTINQVINEVNPLLPSYHCIVVTLGTSWVYKLKETGQVVANCHKVPSGQFERHFASLDEITKALNDMVQGIRALNPEVHFVFTVSPIRHWKDGAGCNMHSKANLIVAVHRVISENSKVSYFPSYEIMMDDLRDYRFYSDDMLHPSKQAIDYIWEKFKTAFIGEGAFEIMKQVEKIYLAAQHRPFNTTTGNYARFVNNHIEAARQLEDKHKVNLDFLIEKLNKQLII